MTDSPSRAMADKARHLPVAETLRPGEYVVASGTVPGATYTVDRALPYGYEGQGETPAGWTCSCVATGPCAHRWAVLAYRDPAVRRMLRRIAVQPAGVDAADWRARVLAVRDTLDGERRDELTRAAEWIAILAAAAALDATAREEVDDAH